LGTIRRLCPFKALNSGKHKKHWEIVGKRGIGKRADCWENVKPGVGANGNAERGGPKGGGERLKKKRKGQLGFPEKSGGAYKEVLGD